MYTRTNSVLMCQNVFALGAAFNRTALISILQNVFFSTSVVYVYKLIITDRTKYIRIIASGVRISAIIIYINVYQSSGKITRAERYRDDHTIYINVSISDERV